MLETYSLANDYLLNPLKLARVATTNIFNPELQQSQEINHMLKIQNKKEVLFSVDSPTPSTVPGNKNVCPLILLIVFFRKLLK